MLKENKELMNRVLAECIMRYGVQFQSNMVMEECAELIQAVNKVLRKGASNVEIFNNLVEEIADVYLVIEQLKMIYLIDDSSIEDIMIQKITRQNNKFKDEDK